MNVLSVDLGTSNTVAVLRAQDRAPRVVEVDGAATMPSAVFAAEDGTILVGRDAERSARLDPSRFEPNPKRRIDEGTLLLGTSVVPVNEVLAAVLRRVLTETCRQLGGAAPEQVRLTHPAQWGTPRRNALLSSARLAGITGELVLVPEPVAAAAHFASSHGMLAPGQALAVYDLGAGTFDVAVVGVDQSGFTVLAEDGLPDLGGLDVDQALMEYVGRQVSHRDAPGWQRLLRPESTADRRARRSLWEDVRAAKETLSRHPQTEVPMPEPFHDVLVTRPELEALIRPSVLRSTELLGATIAATGLAPQSLAGVYLVGGSSRIPLVATLIAERLRVVPVSLDQPETAVALGAHHVPRAGMAVRTAGFTAPQQAPPSQPVPRQQYPDSDRFLAQAQFPATPPQQFPQQPQFQHPQYQAPQQQTPSRKRLPKAALLSVAAVVVLALLGVGGFVLLRGGTGADCTSTEGKGVPGCLRQLAGAVADKADCNGGYDGGAVGLSGLTGAAATCRLGGSDGTHTVVYQQAKSAEEAAAKVKALLDGYAASNQVGADWKGNGLAGSYRSVVASGVGVLVFTVKDQPLVGVLTTAVTSAPDSLTANAVADYFEQNVQPGT
ncbi:Hsp70 family protein [Kutzneria viridogrisea]|uniref:Hsp70 protein n=2 Tax=Kutzneria TaxID=43356 RepID=W5WHI8_9PSEU|nr:Hsp70 family protein [Kutzneria albida]AHI00072.1 hypothetical protein KALB_6713 [Kutzneria albida DSM 43870]MBA8925251.1 hypothetical protein [Kutzneria viridogrisea]